MKPRLWPLLLSAAIGFAILMGLGIWQVRRLAEKEALLAAIDARMAAPAITLAEARRRAAAGEDVEYLHVRASGNYLPGPPLRKITSFGGGAGVELLHPFLAQEGAFVLVDRGTAATDDADPALNPPAGLVEVDGIIRRHDKGQGLFDADNDPAANTWIWWDLPAMWAAANPPPTAEVAPFILQLVPSPALAAKPAVAPPRADLRNNHLGYAITWFGLALTLLVMTVLFARRRRAAT